MSERARAENSEGGLRHLARDQSGKNSLRGIFALVLVVSMVYFGMKFIPVRASAYQFDDAIRDEVIFVGGRLLGRRTSNETIMQTLLVRAATLRLPMKAENIVITRSGNKYIVIEANYAIRIDFVGGYFYDWKFRQRHEGPIF